MTVIKKLFASRFSYYILLLYSALFSWWIFLQIGGVGTSKAYFFNWSYGLVGVSASIYGLYVSYKRWGGYRSLMGRALIFLSLGLFMQWLGLQVWSYYNIILKVEVPYPSLADIGYFGLVPLYSIAAYQVAVAAGLKISLRSLESKILILLIPAIALIFSYWLFLKDIGFDLNDPIKTFFDIAYPLGEIIPVSIAIVTLTLSRNILSGSMKKRVWYLAFAFSVQFFTEYLFLYRAGEGTYVNGGFTDLMYLTSYFIMALGLVYFRSYD